MPDEVEKKKGRTHWPATYENTKINKREFIRAYIDGKPIGECAKLAGSTSKYPQQSGWQLLSRPDVKAEIERLRGEIEKAADEGWRRGIMNIVKIASGEGVNKAATNRDVIDAMDLLGRYRGLFEQKIKLEVGVLPRVSHLSDEVQMIDAEQTVLPEGGEIVESPGGTSANISETPVVKPSEENDPDAEVN